jgi:hypothetical protein
MLHNRNICRLLRQITLVLTESILPDQIFTEVDLADFMDANMKTFVFGEITFSTGG